MVINHLLNGMILQVASMGLVYLPLFTQIYHKHPPMSHVGIHIPFVPWMRKGEGFSMSFVNLPEDFQIILVVKSSSLEF